MTANLQLTLATRIRLKVRRHVVRLRVAGCTGVTIGAGAEIEGMPILVVARGARVEIGSRVTLNSDNTDCHVGMYGRVKLVADQAGAILRIGDETRIHGSCIHAFESVSIGRRCLIAANCQIVDANGHELSFPDVHRRIHTRGGSRPVIVEDDVWLGTGVIVLPGVCIGAGSIVGAGSVVTRDIPPMVIAAGNPAKVIRTAAKDG